MKDMKIDDKKEAKDILIELRESTGRNGNKRRNKKITGKYRNE